MAFLRAQGRTWAEVARELRNGASGPQAASLKHALTRFRREHPEEVTSLERAARELADLIRRMQKTLRALTVLSQAPLRKPHD